MTDDAPFKMWYTFAMLDLGDHGLGVARRDKTRTGIIELTDRIRWVPEEGEGWAFPLAAVTVTTPKAPLGLMFDGLGLQVPGIGTVRVRAMSFAPNVPLPPSDRTTSDARATGRLRKKLIKRGVSEAAG
jgi:hypothetical protein